MPEPYDLTTDEAAAILRVHRNTVLRWVNEEKLPCWRSPGGKSRPGPLKFRRADLDEFLGVAP